MLFEITIKIIKVVTTSITRRATIRRTRGTTTITRIVAEII
jgi:hypothetical protein